MGLLDAFLGGAGDYSLDNKGTMSLLYQAMRDKELDKRYQAEQAQKIREANSKIYENDLPRGFEFTNAEIQTDFNTTRVKPVMEQWAEVHRKANQEGRGITAEEIGRIKMQQEGLKNKKAQADELITNINKASQVVEDDQYGIYPEGFGADLMSTIPRTEKGNIDWEKLDPKSPLKVIGNADNMNLIGLARKFRDSLEENVMTEIATEWEAGELFNRKNTITFKGALAMDEDGTPFRNKDGQVVPLVDNQVMGIVKQTDPRLYYKLEKEEQRAGKSKQEILRETLQQIGGVEERSSRTKVTRSKLDGASTGTGEKIQSFGSNRSTNVIFNADSRTQYVGDHQVQAPLTSSASYTIGTTTGKPKKITVSPSAFVDLASGEAVSRNTGSFELEASELLFLPVPRTGDIPIKFNSEEEMFSFLSKASPEKYTMKWFVKGQGKVKLPEKRTVAQKITSLVDFARSKNKAQQKEEANPLRDVLIPLDQVQGALKQATGGKFDLSDPARPSRDLEEKILNLIGRGKTPVVSQSYQYDNF